jgi:hypothetical protein
VTRGEPRIRPNDLDPGAGSSHLRGFARPRYRSRRVTSSELRLRGFRQRRSVKSCDDDVHGSLDRVKDVSPPAAALIRRHHEECVRLAHADDVPLLISQRTPAVAGATACVGTSPATDETDRPRRALLRQPAKADGIPRIRVPSTVATRVRERIAPPRFPRRPPAHAAHTFSPWLGRMCS